MSKITNLIGAYVDKEIPGKLQVRRKYADEALAEFNDLVGERDNAWTDLEELRKKLSELADVEKVLDDNKKLRQWLGVVLDQVDYTSGACGVTEMVGAVLSTDVIRNARTALKGGKK